MKKSGVFTQSIMLLQVFRRYPLDLTSPVRHMLAGSTPDLVEEM